MEKEAIKLLINKWEEYLSYLSEKGIDNDKYTSSFNYFMEWLEKGYIRDLLED